jgi:hypothetical protein
MCVGEAGQHRIDGEQIEITEWWGLVEHLVGHEPRLGAATAAFDQPRGSQRAWDWCNH